MRKNSLNDWSIIYLFICQNPSYSPTDRSFRLVWMVLLCPVLLFSADKWILQKSKCATNLWALAFHNFCLKLLPTPSCEKRREALVFIFYFFVQTVVFSFVKKGWDNKKIISTCCLTTEARTYHMCVCVCVEWGNKGDVQQQTARLINLSVRLFTVTIKSIPQGAYWEMTRLRPPGTHTTHTHIHTHADTPAPSRSAFICTLPL